MVRASTCLPTSNHALSTRQCLCTGLCIRPWSRTRLIGTKKKFSRKRLQNYIMRLTATIIAMVHISWSLYVMFVAEQDGVAFAIECGTGYSKVEVHMFLKPETGPEADL
ncbi:hypothetical protein DPSP01_009063 [Paraphaeosphaeria sporulosa]